MGIIFNIQKFCIHDGDGIRTCVFLKGCPLRCIWCHNPESFDKSPALSFNKQKCTLCGSCLALCSARHMQNGELKIDRKKCFVCGKCEEVCLNSANEIIGKEITASEVITEVLKDKIFYDTSGGGLTVTGGEPSYQADFTLELLTLAKDSGISFAIETCGIGSRDFYKKAADLGGQFPMKQRIAPDHSQPQAQKRKAEDQSFTGTDHQRTPKCSKRIFKPKRINITPPKI